MEFSKEEYFRAAEIMSNTKSYNVEYTAQILSHIIPINIVNQMRLVMSPEEIERVVQEDGRSVREIAKAMGVGFNTIYRWMSGDRSPEPENLKRLLEVLKDE